MTMDKLSGSLEFSKEMVDVGTNSLSGDILCVSGKESRARPKDSWIKCRYIVLLMGFTVEFFYFAHRINMSVSIVAMVNNSALSKEEEIMSESCLNLVTNTSDEEYISTKDSVKKNGEFNWTPELQGYILGSGFLCNIIAIAPAGKLIELFGCKKILFWGLLLSSAFTFISPFAAWCHVYLLILVQSLRGLFQATVIPGSSVLISNWCPKCERGFSYTVVICGSCWGAVLGSYFSGLLCDLPMLGGWPFAFFAFGGAGIIVSILLGYFMYDNPSAHAKISPAELKYILENQENALTEKRPKTPWTSLLTSIPVYALAVAYFGQVWAGCIFLTVYPTFLGTILHYSIEQNGLLSALPFLLEFITSILSGWLSSLLVNKKYMSINMARKFWNFIACFGFSACLLSVYFAGCNRWVSIVFAIASSACMGFANAGCWIASADMSPTFSASVNTIAGLGFTANFILPVLVGFLTNGMQTIDQWNKLFLISIGVVMSSGVVFSVFGSAEVQPWNDVQEYGAEKDDKKTRF